MVRRFRLGKAWMHLLRAFLAVISFSVSFTSWAGTIQREVLASKSLGREMPFLVYLPDGYDKGKMRYPVLYLLHGAGGNENSWVDRGHIKEKADQLISTGAIPPTLIVMPGCAACWWVDGNKDKAETAFWEELVPAVDTRFRTIADRGGRLLAGLSAGGYGVVRFAMRYPERVGAAAALSPAVYSSSPPPNSAARTQPPFLAPSGQFDQAAWEAHNYPHLINRYFAQRYRVPFYLVSGDVDKFGIAFETALLFKRVFERQPDQVELRVVDGDHSWKVWESTISDALCYIYRFADRPRVPAYTANAGTQVTGKVRANPLTHVSD